MLTDVEELQKKGAEKLHTDKLPQSGQLKELDTAEVDVIEVCCSICVRP